MSTEVLEHVVENETEMKEWLINYVGDKATPEDGNVTVSMIVEAMAEEFPEFVLAVAEENWVRGYQQGVDDTHKGLKTSEESEETEETEETEENE